MWFAPLRGRLSLAKTIAYQSSLDWFSSRKTRGKYSSPKEALREHIQYITRPSECALSWNLKLDDWLRRADSYLSQRRDARIAGKRIFALPNNLNPGEGLNLLKEFLTTRELFSIRRNGKREKVRLSEDDFGIAIHDSRGLSGEKNLHAHVVFSPKTKVQGKEYSLNLTKAELKGLYREWERFLKEKGYSLRRSPVREPHYGPQRLRYDRRARASYRHLSLAKRYWREAIEEEQIARALDRIIRVQEAEGLLSWDEIQREEEQSKPTRGGKKSQESPPPRPRPVKPKPVQQPKPVVKPKPVQQPRQPVQPRVSLLQRPSQQVQHTELEQKTKDPVKRIQKEMEKELAAKRRREQEIARQIDYETKKQARAVNSPPPSERKSYTVKKAPQEVGMNPYLTREVIEEREQEIQRKEQQVQVYQAEMRITYRYRYFQGELTVRFRTLSNWSAEKRKGIAAFLASVVVAYLYGFEFPSEALSFYGKFVEKEALAVREQVKRVVKKPFYSSSQEALEALSVKKTIHVRVRIFEGGKLVEEHNFFLTRESFTIMHNYAETVLKRRPQPPQPPGQGQGQPPQPQQPPEQPDYEDDYDRAPGM